MALRRIFITIAAVMTVSAVFADSASVTSKKYVDDFMTGYQNKIPGSGTNKLMIYDNSDDSIGEKNIVSSLGNNTSATDVPNVGAVKAGMDGKQDTINGTAGYVMTGTGYDGSVGEKPIYGTSSQYNSALVTAETVNTGVINAVNNSLIRVNEQWVQSDSGTLWEIVDDVTALNICSNYTPATGTGVQNGTPTPTNPILPVFYQQGDMILRKVGTYADSYDVNTNKITRRVGVKVLDGTEDWTQYSSQFPSLFYLAASATGGITDVRVGAPILDTIVSHYQVTAEQYFDNINKKCRFQISQSMIASNPRFYIKDTSFTTVAALKTFLAQQYAAGTPVVVYYPLATPVEESMPPRCQ